MPVSPEREIERYLNMKTTEHIRKLLESGHGARELIELGFSKTAVTRVKRQLRKEKETGPAEAPAQPVEVQECAPAPVPDLGEVANTQYRLESLESIVQELRERCDALETQVEEMKEFKVRVIGTPALGLKKHFKCDCGASGLVALRIKCTACDKETWWGWFPKK